ncbi:MAG: zinc ribbon domain-containing protein [Eggerthellaceae bacterium]|nr:zinc ribbon domain-containing protein [Eggerthellaceae bacterium]
MKKCANCGFAETDDARFCSNCGHNSFYEETIPRYASTYSNGSSYRQYARKYDSDDMDKKPIGMAVLTFFLPFIGGYFLIKPDVSPGLRNFGIVWCSLCAVSLLAGETDISVLYNIVSAALCIAPVIVYLFRKYSFEKAMREEAEARRTEDILNTPLQTYADREVEDIARRYQ